MEKIYEPDYKHCEYCEETYYEYDTGYREFGCSFYTGDAEDGDCMGGDIEHGCPLAFKYRTEK